MKFTPLPNLKYLKESLTYDPSTGKLFWKQRPVTHFRKTYRSTEGNCNNWNSRHAGREAFTAISKSGGYRFGTIDKQVVKAHRVVWKLYYGVEPTQEIDHIDGNPCNNRIDNLRQVTSGQNSKNAALSKRNKSGRIGVYWNKGTRSWRARITVDRKVISLGCHKNLRDAIQARIDAEYKYGFHKNHGREALS